MNSNPINHDIPSSSTESKTRTSRRFIRLDRRLVVFFVSLLILITVGNFVVLFARGYNFDFKQKTITHTGIISVSSVPPQASVFLNDKLVTATNNTISNLSPGKYTVKVTKDGFTPWQKEVTVKEEVVTPLEIVLFPSVPDLSPLTFSGVNNPKFSPDQTKIVYAISKEEKAGLWILDLNDRPLIFSKDPKQIVKDGNGFNFSESDYSWTPDSRSVIAKLKGRPEIISLSIDSLSREPFNDIKQSYSNTQKSWEDEKATIVKQRISNLPAQGQQIATSSANIVFSPDEKRFLNITDSGNGKKKATVYDSHPSPDPNVKETTFTLPEADQYLWYPDSQHVILVDENQIGIVEKDGTNLSVIYSGSFVKEVVFPANNGTRLLIGATFNKSLGDVPNLYAINLR